MDTTKKWVIDQTAYLPLAIIEDKEDGLGICEIGERTPQNLENARLIAAAPEMVEFIKDMAERYSNSEWIAGEANKILKSIE